MNKGAVVLILHLITKGGSKSGREGKASCEGRGLRGLPGAGPP